jgi:titin
METSKWNGQLFSKTRSLFGGLAGGRAEGASVRRMRSRYARPCLERLEDRAVPSTFMVTNVADSGSGSLRQAILDANAHPGADVIRFSIGTGARTINVGSTTGAPLPAITGAVTIDATTQPGFNGTPLITLDGARAGSRASGLVLTGSNITVEGFVIRNFAQDGVLLKDQATNDTIGGTVTGQGNIILGNGNDGVEIVGPKATGNTVEGNFIGTDPRGGTPAAAAANKSDGVLVRNGASGNTVGGTSLGAANVISGNGNDGVEIVNSGTTNNRVQGNFIGTDSSGTTAVPNKEDGILIRTGASGNIIGGTNSGAGNTISGNGNDGVEIVGEGTTKNLLQGNSISFNKFDGVLIRDGAAANTVGGSAAAANFIFGNGKDGVEIVGAGTNGNVVTQNFIGIDHFGNKVANKFKAIEVRNGASGNTTTPHTVFGS